MFKETGARKKTTRRPSISLDTESNLQHELEKANMACSVSHEYFSREKSQLLSSQFSPAAAPPPPQGSAPPCCDTQQMMGKFIATMSSLQSIVEKLSKRVIELSDELSDVRQHQANLPKPKPVPDPQLRVPKSRNSSQARDHLPESDVGHNQVPEEESQYRAMAHSQATDSSQQSPPGQENAKLSAMEQDQVCKMLRSEHDHYYTRTLEVKLSEAQKGVWDRMAREPHRSPWKWARSLLSGDKLEGLTRRADSIKLYRNTNSFRITYKTNRCLRSAMSIVGAAQNELRRLDSELHMSYTQLVPPRFKEDRDKLYKLLREARQKKLVRNFHWLVIHNRL